jgi:uncharacterized protein
MKLWIVSLTALFIVLAAVYLYIYSTTSHTQVSKHPIRTTIIKDFFDSATYGNTEAVTRMLADNPAWVSARDEYQFTALHNVAGEDQLDMINLLLDKGADPNAQNDVGIAPLHLAAYPEVAELLVRRGADINLRSHDGSTPLIVHAAEAEAFDVMEKLIRLGADVTAKNKWGESALDIARSRQEEDKIELLQSK